MNPPQAGPEMDFGDRSDNPFSVSLSMPVRPRKRALKSAIGFFLLVCLGLVVSLLITQQGSKWLVQRMTADFDSLTSPERKERLIQISELGPPAIPALAKAMADPDIDVGRTAYELLQRAQNNWSVLEAKERNERHSLLVEAIEEVAVHLPDDRTGWGTSLLQQTLMVTVDRNRDEDRRLYLDANRAIDRLSLSARSQSNTSDAIAATTELESDGQDSSEPKRLQVRARPLPVDQAQATELWTQWPPAAERRFADDLAMAGEPAGGSQSSSDRGDSQTSAPVTVYRSGGPLQPLDGERGVDLNQAPRPQQGEPQIRPADSLPSATSQANELQSVTHLVDSPLETYDDASVMRWLISEHASLRQQAEAELARRGYGAEEQSLARQLVAADTATRLEWIDAIARSGRVDPRPWLLMLLEDPSRDVKLRAISVLATMDDPAVERRLQLHLAEEQDPTVAARIRRVLKLR